jgi:hypothetical protein
VEVCRQLAQIAEILDLRNAFAEKNKVGGWQSVMLGWMSRHRVDTTGIRSNHLNFV